MYGAILALFATYVHIPVVTTHPGHKFKIAEPSGDESKDLSQWACFSSSALNFKDAMHFDISNVPWGCRISYLRSLASKLYTSVIVQMQRENSFLPHQSLTSVPCALVMVKI